MFNFNSALARRQSILVFFFFSPFTPHLTLLMASKNLVRKKENFQGFLRENSNSPFRWKKSMRKSYELKTYSENVRWKFLGHENDQSANASVVRKINLRTFAIKVIYYYWSIPKGSNKRKNEILMRPIY